MLPLLDTTLCQRALQKILFYNRSRHEALEALVSSLGFLGSEEERLASLPYFVLRKEEACPSLSMESTSPQMITSLGVFFCEIVMTILREILVLARANLDKLKKMVPVARNNEKALTLSQGIF